MRNFTLLGLLILFSTDLFGQCSSLVFNPLTHKMDCIGPASTATTPGGSTTQCQYNNAGSFGGITGCTTNGTAVTLVGAALGTPTALVLTNATGLPAASILPGTFGAGNYTVNGNLLVGTSVTIDGSEGTALGIYAATTPDASFDNAQGIEWDISAGKNGQHINAHSAFVNANGFTGVVGGGFYTYTPSIDGGSYSSYVSYYSQSLTDNGATGNLYHFWADAGSPTVGGVFRIREDNTFDSVYQAIPALYNPQFAKYTPGLANYERIVEQWNGNVAEIGTEKSGTGTLRPLRLLGSSLQFNSQNLAPSLTGTTGSIGGGLLAAGACASGTVAVTGSTTTMTVAVSPNTYPGDGTDFAGYVSTNGTVTVKVCALVAVTPTSSTYNVRVIQ